MKQFIYLDNDIVNSIIAQESNGLIQSIKLEKNTTSENSKKNNRNNNRRK